MGHDSYGDKPETSEELLCRLRKLSADEVLAELEEKMEQMTEFSYDSRLVDIYLGVLEEKDPLDLSNEIASMIEDFHKNIP